MPITAAWIDITRIISSIETRMDLWARAMNHGLTPNLVHVAALINGSRQIMVFMEWNSQIIAWPALFEIKFAWFNQFVSQNSHRMGRLGLALGHMECHHFIVSRWLAIYYIRAAINQVLVHPWLWRNLFSCQCHVPRQWHTPACLARQFIFAQKQHLSALLNWLVLHAQIAVIGQSECVFVWR